MTETLSLTRELQEHYAPSNLRDTILTALAAAGKDVEHLTFEDLAPLDEFHVRGRPATLELAEKLALTPDQMVLDLGSGLGGASRYLASTFGSQVTGLDLTEEFCLAAEMLADRLGLSHMVSYQQGNALDMPFEDERFDVVWTQHASMNIEDKPRLYHEIHRVLKPGGRFAMYDILAGEGGPVHFPVPWTHVPQYSFLIRPEDLRRLLQTGFEILSWEDGTEAGRTQFSQVAAKIRQDGVPPLSYQVFLGPDFRQMAENVARNFNEGRIVVIQAIAQKAL